MSTYIPVVVGSAVVATLVVVEVVVLVVVVGTASKWVKHDNVTVNKFNTRLLKKIRVQYTDSTPDEWLHHKATNKCNIKQNTLQTSCV